MSRTKDQLSRRLPTWKLDDREVVWLWLWLFHQKTSRVNVECAVNSTTMRDEITKELQRNSSWVKETSTEKDRSLLPQRSFEWIEEQGRMPDWLAKNVIGHTRCTLDTTLHILKELPSKNYIIAIYDFWDIEPSAKSSSLERLKQKWFEHLKESNIFNWFKQDDEIEKCETAWSWLEKNRPRLTSREKPFRTHSDLLDFFDQSRASVDEKQLYVEKIKRRWSTHKSRKNNPDKKQYNFVLNEEVNASLNRLAQKHNVSRTKVLEALIKAEEEYDQYLSLE